MAVQEPPELEADEVRVKVVRVGARLGTMHKEQCFIVEFDTGDKMWLSERCPWMMLQFWHYAEARILEPKVGFELDMDYFIGKEYIYSREMRSIRPVPEIEDLLQLYKEIERAFLDIQIEDEESIEETGKAGDQGGDWE